MTKTATSSCASATIADEKALLPLPETLGQAICFLEAGALYLQELYFCDQSKRNEGWGNNEGERQAFSILTHKSAELILEDRPKLWTPRET